MRWRGVVARAGSHRGTAGGHRAYTRAHLNRLAFVRHARESGFPLDRVREAPRSVDDPERSAPKPTGSRAPTLMRCGAASRGRALEAELERVAADRGRGRVAECRVITGPADRGRAGCLHSEGHGGPNRLPAWASDAPACVTRAGKEGSPVRGP